MIDLLRRLANCQCNLIPKDSPRIIGGEKHAGVMVIYVPVDLWRDLCRAAKFRPFTF